MMNFSRLSENITKVSDNEFRIRLPLKLDLSYYDYKHPTTITFFEDKTFFIEDSSLAYASKPELFPGRINGFETQKIVGIDMASFSNPPRKHLIVKQMVQDKLGQEFKPNFTIPINHVSQEMLIVLNLMIFEFNDKNPIDSTLTLKIEEFKQLSTEESAFKACLLSDKDNESSQKRNCLLFNHCADNSYSFRFASLEV